MSASNLLCLKIALSGVVGAVGLSSASFPWALGRRSANEMALALIDTFAGGVLAGAGLIHLLSGGIDAFHEALPGTSYPIAPFLAGIGFLLILLIEGVIVAGHPSSAGMRGALRSAAVRHETPFHHADARAAPYPAILLVVLSVHSIILGLALGAQSALPRAVVVFVAIVAHKGAAGFALGVGLERAGFTRRHALPRLIFFSGMTPAGIVAGTCTNVALTARAGTLFEAIFDSIGAGTLLYIAALDIINLEFESLENHMPKWIAAVFGFAIMALLAIWL